MKLAAVVILYHPEKKFIGNILSYSHGVEKLYILDNSENARWDVRSEVANIPDCEYYANGVNEGMGKRLNEALQLADRDGYTHLLTMDQDSAFPENLLEKYKSSILTFPEYQKVGMFAPNHQPEHTINTGKGEEVLSTITSGSIVNIGIIKEAGGYNEELFIDLVDAEICYRLYNARKKIICFTNIIMQHRLGYIVYGRSLKTFRLTPRILHSPIRIYYIVRNVFYMLNRYPNLPPGAERELKNTLRMLKNNVLYHSQRTKVIRYAIKGYLDYRKNKLGKLEVTF